MGNVSSIHGVKTPDFYAPGNAVNEIWIDKFELVSRLPFGDSDLGQASWPPHDWPKIPWHQFIIPLKRDLDAMENATTTTTTTTITITQYLYQWLGMDVTWSVFFFFIGLTSGLIVMLLIFYCVERKADKRQICVV